MSLPYRSSNFQHIYESGVQKHRILTPPQRNQLLRSDLQQFRTQDAGSMQLMHQTGSDRMNRQNDKQTLPITISLSPPTITDSSEKWEVTTIMQIIPIK